MRFLVVDDSATMRRIVVNSLHRIGITDIVEASDGKDALAKFDATIGFIIADWNMPFFGGVEMAKQVRALGDHGQRVPILLMCTRSVRADIITALEAGVSNYIMKPFTPPQLKDCVDVLTATQDHTPEAR